MGHPRTRGFTLVEILVTLAMMGTIMTALYGSYQAVSRARETVGPSYAQTQKVEWMLNRLSRSLRGAYIKSEVSTAAVGVRKTEGDMLSPYDFVAESDSRSTTMTYVRVVATRGTDVCSLQRVYVRWTRSEGLVQMATRPAFSLPEKDLEDVLDWQCLLDHVKVFSLAFLSRDQWSDRWPLEDTNRLPKAIRISVAMETQTGRQETWNVTVSSTLSRSFDGNRESL